MSPKMVISIIGREIAGHSRSRPVITSASVLLTVFSLGSYRKDPQRGQTALLRGGMFPSSTSRSHP